MTSPTTSAVELAQQAADAVQGLNHTTYRSGTPGWYQPGDAYDTVGKLAALSRRLPQTFQQIAALLETLHTAGHLTSSDHRIPGEHVAALARALESATAASQFMTDALDKAHAALSPIGHAE
ncbi:hypothetical protein LIX60_12800 [Streptomyces sp. S07_1.15]|uniref:hypothetical protein n=1 Tax=Streptomyces sp. S07_1.15 TaxID=2873925 RepID=UPI001D139A3F|nr:hypothetical protein [Streptomyces sp. S07_1.15]MCC3652334.1 hypothetical protein [Streptomyces sp. S07_1.15]